VRPWHGRWLPGLSGVWPRLGGRVSKVARRSAMPARVQEVMTIEVVVAQPTTPVKQVARLLADRRLAPCRWSTGAAECCWRGLRGGPARGQPTAVGRANGGHGW
jgi:hypothetical protein